jgi:predicted deacylase
MQAHQEAILSLALPYREKLEIRRSVFDGGRGGPKVGVVAGIHGDELEGLYLCHRLAAELEELSGRDPSALRGRVELYPALNPLGIDTIQRSIPVFDTDLNRAFPGHAEGLPPQRIADAVMRELAGAALVLDVHASNIFLREIPQVRINQQFAPELLPLAQEMNVDLIWVHGSVTVLEATVAHSLNARGVPCLVVEMGVGMRISPELSEQLVGGILKLWKRLGVIEDRWPSPAHSRTPFVAGDHNVHYLNAETSGIFIPSVEHWMGVHRGQSLGAIVSPHRGAVLSEVRSPVDGVLFTLREYPIVYEGSLMARIMEASALNGDGADGASR